jgi:2-alkenal reductase
MEKNMARGNGFLLIVVLILTLIGGAVLGAVAGAGVSLYVMRQSPRVVTAVVDGVPTSKPARVQEVVPTEVPVLPTQLPSTTVVPVDGATAAVAIPDVVAKVGPAVVTVINNDQRGQVGSGSGAVISPDGYIITNNHVVDGASSLDVIFSDGTSRTAALVGADALMDLALLKVDGAVPTYIPIGDSDALRQGETVIAIGSPLGEYKNSVTVGVVSALNRNLDGGMPEGLIQTDAAINNGNSGGPLINMNGEIIGINTMVVRQSGNSTVVEGLGFAIPSNVMRRVSEQLIAKGEVRYPFLGITYVMITADIAEQYQLDAKQGAYVTSVIDGGPVASVGLRAGDVITAFEGVRLGQQASLPGVLLQHQPGDQIVLTVLRDGQESEYTVTLGERPKNS